MVHHGPFRSANRTLAIPETGRINFFKENGPLRPRMALEASKMGFQVL